MGATAQSEAALRGIPRLAPSCDQSSLPRSPEEGFLLSRIDGRTPWALLREIGGLPPDEVDRCLERWIGEGVVLLREGEPEASLPPSPEKPPAPAERSTRADLDGSALDPSLDLPLDAQRSILEFEARLDRPYHELLGVDSGANTKAVKRAYFELSREFHPDRYFRREIGNYGDRLERIFRKLLEAHEILSDPMARAEFERSLAGGGSDATRQAGARGSAARPSVDPDQARRRLVRFAAQAKVLAARKQKAKHYFETGMAAFHAERWLEAAAGVRLAIAFDPGNEAFRQSFVDVQRRAHEERAKQLMKEAEGALEVRDNGRALQAFEEALHFRPHDAELHHRVAKLAWLSSEDLRKAKELAQLACDLRPDEAPYRLLLGRIYKAAGLAANARRELRLALELDPRNAEARSELQGLGRG